MENEPDKGLPEDLRTKLSTPKIYLRGIAQDKNVNDYLSPVEGMEATWSVRLPSGASVGLPGRTAERLNRSSIALVGSGSTDPHRPEWSGISYQPRVALPFSHRRLRTIKGRSVGAFYGIYDTPDARQVYFPRSYPWRCTGRIFTYRSWPKSNLDGSQGWDWSGSGVLIGPRHVLTAGHVAPWGSETWAMYFVPSYWDGASVYGPGASSYVSDYRGWKSSADVETSSDVAYDSCVLRLYDPLGDYLGWMGARTYDDGWQGGNYWILTGYPHAIAGAERPVFQSGVAVLDDDEEGDAMEIEHHGDFSEGESGGPMWTYYDDGPYAIGVCSGGETKSGGFLGWGNEDNNISAGGKAMVDLVKWARSNWP